MKRVPIAIYFMSQQKNQKNIQKFVFSYIPVI